MALVESVKKGGRYTIKEQEERRIQVYHLHFEENRTAVKIAELLGVNRNTINGDIRYWHSQLAHEFNAQNISVKMTKQILIYYYALVFCRFFQLKSMPIH